MDWLRRRLSAFTRSSGASDSTGTPKLPDICIYDEANQRLQYHRPDAAPIGIDVADIISADIASTPKLANHLYYVSREDGQDASSVPSVRFVSSDEFGRNSFTQSLSRKHAIADAETHVVVSAKSGTCLAEEFYHKALRPLLSLAQIHHYKLHLTTSSKSITVLTATTLLPAANEGRAQRVILLSGDGGVVDMVNVLTAASTLAPAYRPPEVCVLPLGTGNALANSSGANRDNTWGLSALLRGSARRVPLLRVAFSPGARLLADGDLREEEIAVRDEEGGSPVMYGAVVCSWGMHAGLVADSNSPEYRKHGAERFKMAANEALFPSDGSPPHAYRARVTFRGEGVEGKEEEGWTEIGREEHAYVLATLVSNLEKAFTISPASKPLDGHLRLVHFGPMPGEEVMRVMGQAYQGGKHVEEDVVGYEDVEAVRIDFKNGEEDPRWRRVCIDGNIVRIEQGGWMEVRKSKKHVLDLVSLDPLD